MNNNVMDESSKLARQTRKAKEHAKRLNTCGYPVLTIERQAAANAVEQAQNAEREFWNNIDHN